MGGRLGEVVEEVAQKYNESQSEVVLVPTYKGGYEDTMTAGIAAFRAGQQPSARTPPPAMMPVPGEAGRSKTLPPPNSPKK